MKKILSLMLFIWVFCFFGMASVKAVKITITGNDKVALNKTIDITFTVSEYNGVSGNLNIDYPSSLLQCNSDCPKSKKVEGNMSFTYQFRAIANGKAVISVTSNYNGADTSKEIIVGTVDPAPAQPTQPAQPTTTTTTQAPKSNNANLKALEIRGNDDSEVILSPNFSSSVYEYQATVDATVKTILINPTPEDSKANVVISNNAMDELKAGENNKITITVTAEDGTKKAYVVNVKRETLTADAFLKSLTVKESKDFKFKEDKFSYNVKVASSVNRLTLDYETSSEDAVVSINGNMNLKNGSKVKILVTAEDGTKKEYVLNIVKETKTTKKVSVNVTAEKNPLVIMALSMVGFGLIGAIIYVIKK